MENENNKIKLSQYIQACVDLKEDPADAVKESKINNFLAQMIIKPYMTLQDKLVVAGSIIYTLADEYDALGAASHVEIRKITKGLLSYVTNLENDVYNLQDSYSVYDVILQYGMYDAIIKYCESDFNRLTKIIDETFNFSNIYKLLESAQFFTEDGYKNWEEGMKNLKTELTPDLMKNIQELIKLNSTEGAQQFEQDVGDQVVNELNIGLRKKEENIKKDLTK